MIELNYEELLNLLDVPFDSHKVKDVESPSLIGCCKGDMSFPMNGILLHKAHNIVDTIYFECLEWY